MMGRDQYYAEVTALREKLEEAQERVRQLEALIHPKQQFPIEWRLTRSCGRLLAALLAVPPGAMLTKSAAYAAIVVNHGWAAEEGNIVAVRISHLRQRLSKIAPQIERPVRIVWAQGYYLTPEARAFINAAIQQIQVAA